MTAGAGLVSTASVRAQGRGVVRPPRLRAGDAVGVFTPATATLQRLELEIVTESLTALGLEVKVGEHVMRRHGSLGGSDRERADDLNRFLRDRDIKAVIPTRVGWGSARLLPLIDMDAARRNPKVLIGYSDISNVEFTDELREKMLEGAKEGAIENMHATLDNEENITLDGIPGRSIRFTADNEGQAMHGRFDYFMVGNRLYQVGYIALTADGLDTDAVRSYFKSFKIDAKAGKKKGR